MRSSPEQNTTWAIGLMLMSDLAFAIMAAATKWTGDAIPSYEIIFVRSVISAAVLWAILHRMGVPLKGQETGILVARGVFGYMALQCYFWALPQLPLSTAVMLNYTAPLFAVGLSLALLREKPSRSACASLAVSFVGVWLLSEPSWHAKPAAILAGLVSGALAGFVHVLIRRGNRSDHPLLIIFYFTVASALGSGFFCAKEGWVTTNTDGWIGLLLITASSFLGQLCLTHSLQKAHVWKVSPFGYFTPILGGLIGWWFWHERPNALSVLGGTLIILSGSALLVRFYMRRTGSAATPKP